MNPFVFIVGSARSGTTLLQRLLDAHPQLAIVQRETHWIPDYYLDRTGLTPDGMVTAGLLSKLMKHRTFSHMGIGRQDLEQLFNTLEPLPYARFVSSLFDLYGAKRGKGRVGDKTPRYVRRIPVLHSLWPEAMFVHLIRDGRDVCLSILDWRKKVPGLASLFPTWAEDPVTTAALLWELSVRLGRRDGLPLGTRIYHEIRYEDLVSRPQEECARLCTFLGVIYDPAMLRFHEHGFPQSAIRRQPIADKPGMDAKHAWLPVTPGLRNWRVQMAADDVERFESAAGGLLDELGYARACPRPSPAAATHAGRIRAQFPDESFAELPALSSARSMTAIGRKPIADSR
jgi:hypothetical protein